MKARLKLTGTGTSVGIPVIGCGCDVCRSKDPKDKRLRTGGLVLFEDGKAFLIDAPTDFREQALRYTIKRVDGVLLTHHHADHIFGLDELRIYNHYQKSNIPIFVPKWSFSEVKRVYKYTFKKHHLGGGIPKLEFVRLKPKPFIVEGIKVTPIPIFHGKAKIFGYRIGNMAYITDISSLPEKSFPLLSKLDVLVLSMLRPKPHPTHLTVKQAVELAERINAKNTYFTHISHFISHAKLHKELPSNLHLAHDGLEINFEVEA